MKLNKLFRKYNRTLILVFMSLLLVTFLLADVISSWRGGGRSPGDIEIGTAFGAPFTQYDVARVDSDRRIASPMGFVPIQIKDEVDAFLLVEEARRTGVRVGAEEVKATLTQFGLTGDTVRRIADQNKTSLERVYEAIGQWMAVSRVQRFVMESIEPSKPRIEQAYRDQQQLASIKFSILDSNGFVSGVADPDDEELARYFEQGKDREDAHTEDELVFGYRQSDRVRVEYLTVDPQALRNQISVSSAEAKRYYEQNLDNYVRRVPRPGTSTQPGGTQFDQIQQDFEQVKQKVRDDRRAEKAVEEAQRLVNRMRDEAMRPWTARKVGKDGFREAPQEDLTGAFETLRDKYASSPGVSYQKTELLDADALRRESDFGQANLTTRRRASTNVSVLALRVKGILEDVSGDPVSALNVFEPSKVITRQTRDPRTRQSSPYQSYFFRVVEVVPAGPPESIDDVREKLVKDVKMIKAHEMAGIHARNLLEKARASGIDGALDDAGDLKTLLSNAETLDTEELQGLLGPAGGGYVKSLGPFTYENLARARSWVQYDSGFLISNALAEAVFALAEQPTTDTSPAYRVALVQVANNPNGLATDSKWLIVELIETKPIYREPFEQSRASLVFRQRTQEQQAVRFGWYDSEQLRRRTRYAPPPEPTQQ